jgi:hypothetical protein
MKGNEMAEEKALDVYVTVKTPLTFDSNFGDVKKELKAKLKKFKGMKVSDANFEEAKFVQKQCVTTRTLLDNRMKEAIKTYIDLPKDALKQQFNELFALVAEVEDNIKVQMDVYEDERKAEVEKALKMYVDSLQKEYKLRDKYFTMVQFKKSFFNKTAKESESRADIKDQFDDAKKLQEEYDSNVEIIKGTVKGNKLLNEKHWIDQLEFRSLAGILVDLRNELTRVEAVEEEVKEDAIKIGASTSAVASFAAKASPVPPKGKKVKNKTMKIEITYPEYLGDMISDFFNDNPEIKVVKL